MDEAISPAADARRRQILSAAFDCFVRYGYSKITMQDVAKAAGVSRPLIYTFYGGKEELFLAMFQTIFEDQLARVTAIAATSADAHERLLAMFEIVYVELWEKLTGSAEGADLLDTSGRLFPKIADGYSRALVKIIATIVGDETRAHYLMLSGKGMSYDRPKTEVLRERLAALVGIFEKARGA